MIDNEYQQQRALCTATVSWLRACSVVAAWSLGLSLVAMALLTLGARSLAMPTIAGLGVVGVMGLLERYLALRIRLDVGLFQGLADGSISSVGVLDTSLEQLGLRKAATVQRSLEDRIRGARQLAQRHLWLVVLQSAAFAGAVLTLR